MVTEKGSGTGETAEDSPLTPHVRLGLWEGLWAARAEWERLAVLRPSAQILEIVIAPDLTAQKTATYSGRETDKNV